MLKVILVSMISVGIFLGQAVAVAAPIQAMGLKDFKITSISNKMTEVVYKGDTLTVERVGETHFKLNGKDVIFKNTDTLESVYDKTLAAYKSSGKKSASLDDIFVPRAHAVMPPLVGGIFGLILGLGIGTNMGKKQCEQDATGTTSGTAPAYDQPVTVQ